MTDILEDGSVPARFRNLVAARYGLQFDEPRLGYLGEVVRRAADLCGCSPNRYLALLEAGRPDVELPADELTVGETYFFRNIAQFTAFREVALPARLEAIREKRKLSVLSAGCASGEEPFTIAMVLREDLPPSEPDADLLAVDVNPIALGHAARGRYAHWATREMPPAALERWFRREGRGLMLADEIRRLVRFGRCNLADPDADIWSADRYDVIFCRNVIMYFTPAMQRTVVGRLARSLVPGGYLFLGHAESLRGLTDELRLIHTHGTFYYQRPSDAEFAAIERRVVDAASACSAAAPDVAWNVTINAAADRIQSLAQLHPLSAKVSPVAAEAPPSSEESPDLGEAVRLVQAGQIAAAADICAQILDADALDAGATYVLGLCLEARGDTIRARKQYDAAIEIDPYFAMPRLRRGLLAQRAGLPNAAAELATAAALLDIEDGSRLELFGGGFGRSALIEMCWPSSRDLRQEAG